MERRFSTTAVSLEDRSEGLPLIVGYAAVFYRDDEPGSEFELFPGLVERIAPTAFNRMLTERADIRGLFNHDPAAILGRSTAGTMRLQVDERGLRYEIDPPDTQFGRDTITSIRRGDISGSSFSFTAPPSGAVLRSEETTDVRELRDVTLYDVGPVTFPAYGSTSTAIRSAASELAEIRTEYERWKSRQTIAPQVLERLKELRDDGH